MYAFNNNMFILHVYIPVLFQWKNYKQSLHQKTYCNSFIMMCIHFHFPFYNRRKRCDFYHFHPVKTDMWLSFTMNEIKSIFNQRRVTVHFYVRMYSRSVTVTVRRLLIAYNLPLYAAFLTAVVSLFVCFFNLHSALFQSFLIFLISHLRWILTIIYNMYNLYNILNQHTNSW